MPLSSSKKWLYIPLCINQKANKLRFFLFFRNYLSTFDTDIIKAKLCAAGF